MVWPVNESELKHQKHTLAMEMTGHFVWNPCRLNFHSTWVHTD